MKSLALACLLAACNPMLSAQTPAPPGRTARLDPVTSRFWGIVQSYRLDVSQGVALAITCTDGGPCEKLAASSENPAVAEVRLASLSLLQPAAFGNQQPAAALVVVGKAPGATRIVVHSRSGSREIAVTVDAPAAAGVAR